MNRHNYACFHCRVANKGGGICKKCNRKMVHLGPKWRVPGKNKEREWKSLAALLKSYNPYFKMQLEEHGF